MGLPTQLLLEAHASCGKPVHGCRTTQLPAHTRRSLLAAGRGVCGWWSVWRPACRLPLQHGRNGGEKASPAGTACSTVQHTACKAVHRFHPALGPLVAVGSKAAGLLRGVLSEADVYPGMQLIACWTPDPTDCVLYSSVPAARQGRPPDTQRRRRLLLQPHGQRWRHAARISGYVWCTWEG